MNLLPTLILTGPQGSTTLTDVVGLPSPLAVLVEQPERVQVLLLGTIHQARAIAAAPTEDDAEQIEVTTACGLTGTTNLWRYPTFQMITTSAAWDRRACALDVMARGNPPCPRCFPPPADGAGVAHV